MDLHSPNPNPKCSVIQSIVRWVPVSGHWYLLQIHHRMIVAYSQPACHLLLSSILITNPTPNAYYWLVTVPITLFSCLPACVTNH